MNNEDLEPETDTQLENASSKLFLAVLPYLVMLCVVALASAFVDSKSTILSLLLVVGGCVVSVKIFWLTRIEWSVFVRRQYMSGTGLLFSYVLSKASTVWSKTLRSDWLDIISGLVVHSLQIFCLILFVTISVYRMKMSSQTKNVASSVPTRRTRSSSDTQHPDIL